MPNPTDIQTVVPDTTISSAPPTSSGGNGNNGSSNQGQGTTPFVRGAGDRLAIDQNDAIQDGLGNCGFVAAMRSVAVSNPGVIQNAITANQDGTYNVKLYLNGAGNPPTSIKVSPDNLPRKIQDSQGNIRDAIELNGDILNGQQEIWPNLIEKALVQAQGGTFQNNRNAAEYMTLLTGRPSASQQLSTLTNQQIANNLKGALNAGNPVTVQTPNSSDKINTSAGQLVGNHAYTVTAVDTKNMTVNLRNPWGTRDLIGLPISDLKQYFNWSSINQIHQQQNLQGSIAPNNTVPIPANTSPLPTNLFENMDLRSIHPSDPIREARDFSELLRTNYEGNLENYQVMPLPEGKGNVLTESGTPLLSYNQNNDEATSYNLISRDTQAIITAVLAEQERPLEQEQPTATARQSSDELVLG
jgi:hypothetical protein